MTDFRALCAELLSEYEYSFVISEPSDDPLVQRAYAALAAEPVPEGPSKAELRQLFLDHSGYIDDELAMRSDDFLAAARAVLARWGQS